MNTFFIKLKKPISGPFWPKKFKTNFFKKKKKKKSVNFKPLCSYNFMYKIRKTPRINIS